MACTGQERSCNMSISLRAVSSPPEDITTSCLCPALIMAADRQCSLVLVQCLHRSRRKRKINLSAVSGAGGGDGGHCKRMVTPSFLTSHYTRHCSWHLPCITSGQPTCHLPWEHALPETHIAHDVSVAMVTPRSPIIVVPYEPFSPGSDAPIWVV